MGAFFVNMHIPVFIHLTLTIRLCSQHTLSIITGLFTRDVYAVTELVRCQMYAVLYALHIWCWEVCRMFHLKGNPNYGTHKTTKPTAISDKLFPLLQLGHCLKWYWRNFGVISAVLSLDEHLSQALTLSRNVQSEASVLLSYSVLPCQDKCCKMLHKRFLCEVIFENEHTPVRFCTPFALLALADA
jgi:hypothetical protein